MQNAENFTVFSGADFLEKINPEGIRGSGLLVHYNCTEKSACAPVVDNV
jgi:hypothetical protein